MKVLLCLLLGWVTFWSCLGMFYFMEEAQLPVPGNLSYDDAWDAAIVSQKPLVIYVKQEPRPINGCVVCRLDRVLAQPVLGIVVCTPSEDGRMVIAFTRDGLPSPEWIVQMIMEWKNQKKPCCFM